MTIPTTQLLAELRRDHANVSLLLEILEEQSQRLLAMERPDYDVMDDIMHYMTSFADAVHHPKEDVLYRRLRKLRPELQGPCCCWSRSMPRSAGLAWICAATSKPLSRKPW